MFETYTSDVPAVPDPDFRPLSPDAHLYRTRSEAVYDQLTFDYQLDNPEFIVDPVVEAKVTFHAKTIFETFKAQAYIDKIAVYDADGRLNLHRTSQRIGVPFDYDMQGYSYRGMITGELFNGSAGESPTIHLNKNHESQLLTFGHEIGHYFFRAVSQIERPSHSIIEEDFCDHFGATMAMPQKFVEDYEVIDEVTILEIMSRFQLSLNDTITQLQRYKKLPPRVAIDTYYGRVKNPDYSEKVTRGIICLGCNQPSGYSCSGKKSKIPLFNFTDRAWGEKMMSCIGERAFRPNIMSTLTKYYMAKETQLILFRPGATFED